MPWTSTRSFLLATPLTLSACFGPPGPDEDILRKNWEKAKQATAAEAVEADIDAQMKRYRVPPSQAMSYEVCGAKRLGVSYDPVKDVLSLSWGRNQVLGTHIVGLAVAGDALIKEKPRGGDLGLIMVKADAAKGWQHAAYEIRSPASKQPRLFPAGKRVEHALELITMDELPRAGGKFERRRSVEKGWSVAVEVPTQQARTAYLDALRLRERRRREAKHLESLVRTHRYAFQGAAEHLDQTAAQTQLADLKRRRDDAKKRLSTLPPAPKRAWTPPQPKGPCS